MESQTNTQKNILLLTSALIKSWPGVWVASPGLTGTAPRRSYQTKSCSKRHWGFRDCWIAMRSFITLRRGRGRIIAGAWKCFLTEGGAAGWWCWADRGGGTNQTRRRPRVRSSSSNCQEHHDKSLNMHSDLQGAALKQITVAYLEKSSKIFHPNIRHIWRSVG